MSAGLPTGDITEAAHTRSWRQRHARTLVLAVRITLVLVVAALVAWWLLVAPVPVTSHTVATGTVRDEVLGTGTLEARTSAVVGPKIGGLIVGVGADQGDEVKEGAVLFQLEDSDTHQQVRMAESEVAAAPATLERLRASQRRAEAVLAQAKTNYERLAELRTIDVGTQQDLDKAFEALSIAEAELSITAAAIIEGQKRWDAAERSLDYQRARLEDTTIEAPFDGLVVRRDRDVGDVVAPGASVFELVSTAEMWITAWVDETKLAALQQGQPARVVFRSEPGVDYPGEVARVGREADRETREIVVDVRVEKLPANWAVGQRAEVYIGVDRRDNVTVLPAGLVLVREGKTGVIVDDGGKARWRAIEVGLRGREAVEVAAGLSPGETVVVAADPSGGPLREGRRITEK